MLGWGGACANVLRWKGKCDWRVVQDESGEVARGSHTRPCSLLRILPLTLRAVGSLTESIRPSEGASPKVIRRHFLPQKAPLSQMAAGGVLLLPLFGCGCILPVPRENCPVLERVRLGMAPALGFSPFPGPHHSQPPLGVCASCHLLVSFLI